MRKNREGSSRPEKSLNKIGFDLFGKPNVDLILSNIGAENPESVVPLIMEVHNRAGVPLDEFGMVINSPELVATTEVETDLVGVKKSIDKARKDGRHIVYIPGSYDLVHAGHASYAIQVVDSYLDANPKLSRKDLYVVMLADDDDMIKTVKAYKWEGNGGNEPFRRPIQASEHFEDITNANPRLADLATLPVDLVGFIPSPRNSEKFIKAVKGSELPDGEQLRKSLLKFALEKNPPEVDIKELTEAVSSYELLVNAINNNFGEVVSAFADLADPTKKPEGPSAWTVQSWQFLVHKYLASGDAKSPFVRVVSEKDDKYKYQVEFLMGECGIKVCYIDDKEVISTTNLLKIHGSNKLVNQKRGHYALLGDGYRI